MSRHNTHLTMNDSTLSPEAFYNAAPYNTLHYSPVAFSYYLLSGSLSAIGNFYLVVLFFSFGRLRNLSCNWLIIFECMADFLLGNFKRINLK